MRLSRSRLFPRIADAFAFFSASNRFFSARNPATISCLRFGLLGPRGPPLRIRIFSLPFSRPADGPATSISVPRKTFSSSSVTSSMIGCVVSAKIGSSVLCRNLTNRIAAGSKGTIPWPACSSRALFMELFSPTHVFSFAVFFSEKNSRKLVAGWTVSTNRKRWRETAFSTTVRSFCNAVQQTTDHQYRGVPSLYH